MIRSSRRNARLETPYAEKAVDNPALKSYRENALSFESTKEQASGPH